jgi:hypothetical protein
MKKRVTILTAVVLGVFMLMAGNSQADINGQVWYDASGTAATDCANNPASCVSSLPPTDGSIPYATFSVPAMNFSSGSFVSYDTWLNNPTWGTTAGGFDKTTFHTAGGFVGTFFRFTGTVALTQNQTIPITHDDGFYLTVGTATFDYSTPVSPQTDTLTWSGASGTYNFEVLYGATNGFPEVLQVSNFATVPEPGTLMFLGLGLVGMAGVRRRIKK